MMAGENEELHLLQAVITQIKQVSLKMILDGFKIRLIYVKKKPEICATITLVVELET
jgi:hypothetical protein